MISNHVASLELSKQLDKAGIKIESEFIWIEHWDMIDKWYVVPNSKTYDPHVSKFYPAPLSSELWEVLKKFKKENYDQVPTWDTYHKKWYFQASYDMGDITEWLEVDTEANARAKMLLYLKEKELI